MIQQEGLLVYLIELERSIHNDKAAGNSIGGGLILCISEFWIGI